MGRKNSIDNTTNLDLENEMTAKAGLGNMQYADNDNNKQVITNSDIDNTDLEIETKSTSNDQMEIANSTMDKLDNPRSPRIIISNIELDQESKGKEKESKNTGISYSQALQQNLENNMQTETDTDYSDHWQQHVRKAIEKVTTKEFDTKIWNYDQII